MNAILTLLSFATTISLLSAGLAFKNWLIARAALAHEEDFYQHPQHYCCLCGKRFTLWQRFVSGNTSVKMHSFGDNPAHIICAADFFREKIRRELQSNSGDAYLHKVATELFDKETLGL